MVMDASKSFFLAKGAARLDGDKMFDREAVRLLVGL